MAWLNKAIVKYFIAHSMKFLAILDFPAKRNSPLGTPDNL